MKTCVAPGEPNPLRLEASLQVRVDVRDLGSLSGRIRLRGYDSPQGGAVVLYDECQNLVDAHVHVTDHTKAVEFLVLGFSRIPPKAFLTLEVETADQAHKTVFRGRSLAQLSEAAS